MDDRFRIYRETLSRFSCAASPETYKHAIKQAVEIIKNGGVVVYPTDSGYAFGCQLENEAALERICQIRRLNEKHNFTLLCRDLSELSLNPC